MHRIYGVCLAVVLVFVLFFPFKGADSHDLDLGSDDYNDDDTDGATVITHHGVPEVVYSHGNNDSGSSFEEHDQDDENSNQTTSTRRKRFISANEARRWTGGVVPYKFADSMEPDEIHEIKVAMWRIETYTCIRFVPWVEGVTRVEHHLNHDGFLIFVNDRDGCSSAVGNRRSSTGQTLKCCGRGTCVHELGHSLGLSHEHQSPFSYGWMRFNWENIKKDYWQWYRRSNPEGKKFYEYDISSYMGYGKKAFNSNGHHTITTLFPELFIGGGVFYPFHEITESHQCAVLECPTFSTTCENDGYPTLINNECACNCPAGFDRSSGCTKTLTKAVSSASGFPGGSYALLASVEGCPGGGIFSEGELTHWSNGKGYTSKSFHLKGDYQRDSSQHSFCVIENHESTVPWPQGAYCIHRVGDACPSGFDEGYIQFDDVIRSAEQSNSYSGSVPDGVFGDDTLFYFCCRDDGFSSEPLLISDTSEPFVLYKYTNSCPLISGMFVVSEYFAFYNNIESGSIATYVGAHPKLYTSSSGRYNIYYCYYTPLDMDCGGVIELDASNPTAIITSPNYPGLYEPALECNWFVKGPEDSTLVLNFDDFDIEASGSSCNDGLHIRHSLLGQPAIEYCGDGMKGSIRSIFNTIGLTFTTDLEFNRRGFNATVSLIQPEDNCYDLTDNGKSYRGTINYTRTMEACLPWTSTVSCQYHAFDQRYVNDGLDGNYCRNPGDGLRPWCYTGYTELDGCVRNYCDVCQYENVYDAGEYCDMVDESLCAENPDIFSQCAKSCLEHMPSQPEQSKVTELFCNSPVIPEDGMLVSLDRCSYTVGETVEVACNSTGLVVTSTCMTDGSWDLGNYLCGVCPPGWSSHNGFCYKYFEEYAAYEDAQSICAEYGGIIAPTMTEDETNYVISQRQFMQKIWLGGDDENNDEEWTWPDGSDIVWNQWKDGQPKSYRECAIIESEDQDNVWYSVSCSSTYNFICRMEIPGEERTDCIDKLDNCVDLFTADPTFCKEYPDFAQYECACTCGVTNGGSCTVPDLIGEKVRFVSSKGGNVDTGDYVTYRCSSSSVFQGGHFIRGCLPNGELTGEEPICVASWIGSSRDFYTGLSDHFNITQKGEIKEWRLQSKYAGEVGLQVWRMKEQYSFEFIGQNLVMTIEEGQQIIPVPAADRIQVEVGDLIGVYYGPSKGGVHMSYCSSSDGVGLRSTVDYGKSFVPGWLHETRDVGCHKAYVTALVGPSDYSLNNNVELISRANSAESERVYTGSMPEFSIREEGEIAEWHFYSASQVTVSLQIWRSVLPSSFELVGQNTFVTDGNGLQVFVVEEKDRINVAEGDLIGVYQQQDGGIPFDTCDVSEGLTVTSTERYAASSDLTKGEIYSFDTAQQCHRFSVSTLVRPHRTTALNNYVDIRSRSHVGGSRTVYTGGLPDFYIRQTGVVSEWHLYSTGIRDMALQIYRRINDTTFKFIGQNEFQTIEDGLQVVEISSSKRIKVEKGDLIGIYYGEGDGGVCYSYCKDTEGVVVKKRYLDPEDFVLGTEFPITYGPRCRRYSVAAMVKPA